MISDLEKHIAILSTEGDCYEDAQALKYLKLSRGWLKDKEVRLRISNRANELRSEQPTEIERPGKVRPFSARGSNSRSLKKDKKDE